MLEHELDSLIDQALPSYGAEPTADLEVKIIAAARLTPMLVKKSRRARWMGLASGIAAAGFVGMFLFHHDQEHHVPRPDQAFVSNHVVPFVSSQTSRPGQAEATLSHAVSINQRRLKRAAKKPSNSEPPLTDQEEMLVALATQHPSEARQLISRDASESEPLRIEPLSVQPISTEPLKIAAIQQDPLP